MESIVVKFHEVKAAFEKIVAKGENTPTQWGSNCHTSELERCARNPEHESSWIGGSGQHTLDYMRKGFSTPEFRNAGKRVQTVERKKRVYNDYDGTLDFDRLMAGDQNFLGKRERRTIKPGMKVNVQMGFAAMVAAKDIAEYGVWIASFIGALEKQGIDLEVNVVDITEQLFRGQARNDRTETIFRVKEQGEKSRFASWSVLFAPTGYRHLIFTGYHVAGEKVDKQVEHNLGYSMPNTKWGFEYCKKENRATIKCNQRGRGFDSAKLTTEAKKHGLL